MFLKELFNEVNQNIFLKKTSRGVVISRNFHSITRSTYAENSAEGVKKNSQEKS